VSLAYGPLAGGAHEDPSWTVIPYDTDKSAANTKMYYFIIILIIY
jgi:hypothetical protein